MKKKIAIIGAGWFGCHIALEILKLNKFKIQIFERNKDIFNGASSNNQNRLHLGFHYPRSKKIFNLIDQIKAKKSAKLTLGGCIITREKKHIILKKEIKS